MKWEINADDADVELLDNEKGPIPISKRKFSALNSKTYYF